MCIKIPEHKCWGGQLSIQVLQEDGRTKPPGKKQFEVKSHQNVVFVWHPSPEGRVVAENGDLVQLLITEAYTEMKWYMGLHKKSEHMIAEIRDYLELHVIVIAQRKMSKQSSVVTCTDCFCPKCKDTIARQDIIKRRVLLQDQLNLLHHLCRREWVLLIMSLWALGLYSLLMVLLRPPKDLHSLHPRVLQVPDYAFISLSLTLLSECYLKMSTSIWRRTILACYLRTILPLFNHYYACL